jgi:tetratricopeptide (TPR) repeat protein
LESPIPVPAKAAPQLQPAAALAMTAQALKEEAIAVARQLMEDFPDSTDAIGLMGSVYMRFSETGEAAKWWQKCIEQNPRRADAYHGLAKIAYAKGDREAAVELWHKAQAINPNVPGMHGALGKALLEMGQPEEALGALEKETRLSPADGNIYYLLGKAQVQQKQYERAVANYQKAVELAPGDSRPYYGLATACARLGQADQAREYMEKFKIAKAREEEDAINRLRGADDRVFAARVLAQTHADAGQVYVANRRFKDAEHHWQRAAALDPKNRSGRQALVGLYRESGRLAEAVPICEQLLAIDLRDPTYHLNTGIVYGELQRYDAAEAEIRKAIELAPNNACACRTLVQLLLVRNEKLPEARTVAQKLVALEPTARNYSILGEACRRNGDPDGARNAAKRVMELSPGGVNAGGASLGLQP